MAGRITKALAATAVAALPLLAACGGASSAPAGSAAPPASSAPATSAAAPSASATPSSKPSDETENVQAATRTFIEEIFTLNYSEDGDAYAARVKPLVTPKLYAVLVKEVDVDKNLKTARARFGKDARAKSKTVGKVKVDALSADAATTTVKWAIQIQQPDGEEKWKTIKESPDDTATVSLVKDGDDWLVDDAK